jgi:hypothetical protein
MPPSVLGRVVQTTRRALLRAGAPAGAAVLAGCLATSDDRATDTATRTPTGTPPPTDPGTGSDPGGTRPGGTGGPSATLVSVDDAPALPVRPSVEVVEPTATADHPPGFRVGLVNDGDEAVRVGEGRAVRFAFVADATGGLVLLPADGEYDAEPGCWRLAEPVAVTEEYRVLTIQPGETLASRVDLYALPGDDPDACLPVGEYRFESAFATTTDPGGVPGETSADRTATWGFSVLLE